MSQKVLPTDDPKNDGALPPHQESPLIIIDPAISKAIFALYEGKRMTSKDSRDARNLAALWQIAKNLYAIHAQSIMNASATIEAIKTPPCPECGK